MKRAVLWGASGHAAVVAEALELEGRYELHGCIDDVDPTARRTAAGPVVGSSERLTELVAEGVTHFVVAIGHNETRLRLAERAAAAGLEPATVVHPRATVSARASLGPGTVVLAGAVVAPMARLGAHGILNHAASVDHDCELGDGVHVAPGAHLAGHVTVEEASRIGVGAAVRDRVRIGARATVGAGAAVVSDLPADRVATGVPARVVDGR